MTFNKIFTLPTIVGAIFLCGMIHHGTALSLEPPLEVSLPLHKETIGVVQKYQKFSDWNQNKHRVELEGILGTQKVVFIIELDAQEMVNFQVDEESNFEIIEETPDEQMFQSIFSVMMSHGVLYKAKGSSIHLSRKDFEPYILKKIDESSSGLYLYLNHYDPFIVGIEFGNFLLRFNDGMPHTSHPLTPFDSYFHIGMALRMETEENLHDSPGNSLFTFRPFDDETTFFNAVGKSLDAHWTPTSQEVANALTVVDYRSGTKKHGAIYYHFAVLSDGRMFAVNNDYCTQFADVMIGDKLVEVTNNQFVNLHTFKLLTSYVFRDDETKFATLHSLKKTWSAAKVDKSLQNEESISISTPKYLYKILAANDWEAAQKGEFLPLTIEDQPFIHLSTLERLDHIIKIHWFDKSDFVILEIETEKLSGNLIFEALTGGDKYYNLYNAAIPIDAIRGTL